MRMTLIFSLRIQDVLVNEVSMNILMAMRRTIETRFSELCAFFDVEQTLARGLTGLQLRMEQIVLAYNLRYFEIN